jgi:flagellar hook assembly protein FlgD
VDVAGAPAPKLHLAFVSSNPTRGEVRMKLELPEAAPVTAEVLDALGRRVRSPCRGSDFARGTHLITWDGANESGAPTAAGVYFVRVRAGTATLVSRVVQLR